MDKQQVEEMVTLLSREFNVRRPLVSWSHRAKRGRAYHRQWKIATGPRCWRGVEASTIHEFAHILAWKRYGLDVLHDERFCYVLWHVARAWYGCPSRYPWHNEYKRVAAFGRGRLIPSS